MTLELPELPGLAGTPGIAGGRDPQQDAPFADSLRAMARMDWLPFHVPGHQSRSDRNPLIADLFGDQVARMDLPMSMASIDQTEWTLNGDGSTTPMARSLELAAQAWGARRAWWVVNGASGGNHIACLALRSLGSQVVVQRSMHSSVIDGFMLAGITPHFVEPTVDEQLGGAQGVTVEAVREVLDANPESAAIYIVSPSYFGAVADVPALAELAHSRGIPLIVDEAWGSHFGFHPQLPINASRAGADLVISSTHKAAGSLTQSAMLLLGQHAQAARLEQGVVRAHRAMSSTSSSALLMYSLDEARRHLVNGFAEISRTVAAADAIRVGIRERGRFTEHYQRVAGSTGAVDADPLKIVIETASGGISGREAQHLLLRDHRVAVEMSTYSSIVLLLGATAEPDVERFLDALHALPCIEGSAAALTPPRNRPPRQVGIREAFLHEVEVVPAAEAVGRVSADSLAAYPPGIPNVLPGEVLSQEVVDFLRATAATAAGYVRGGVDQQLTMFRVLSES